MVTHFFFLKKFKSFAFCLLFYYLCSGRATDAGKEAWGHQNKNVEPTQR